MYKPVTSGGPYSNPSSGHGLGLGTNLAPTPDTTGAGEVALDPDHRLALKSSQPLLKSRNAGVVLGVCSLHYTSGPLDASISQQVRDILYNCICTTYTHCIHTMLYIIQKYALYIHIPIHRIYTTLPIVYYEYNIPYIRL